MVLGFPRLARWDSGLGILDWGVVWGFQSYGLGFGFRFRCSVSMAVLPRRYVKAKQQCNSTKVGHGEPHSRHRA